MKYLTLFWGDNGSHEFWEDMNHEFLLFRNHTESGWHAHKQPTHQGYQLLFHNESLSGCVSNLSDNYNISVTLSNRKRWCGTETMRLIEMNLDMPWGTPGHENLIGKPVLSEADYLLFFAAVTLTAAFDRIEGLLPPKTSPASWLINSMALKDRILEIVMTAGETLSRLAAETCNDAFDATDTVRRIGFTDAVEEFIGLYRCGRTYSRDTPAFPDCKPFAEKYVLLVNR